MGARRHDVALAAALLAALAAWPAPDADAQARRARNVYGAIAYHRATDSVGYAYDFTTERAASVAALNQCGQPAARSSSPSGTPAARWPSRRRKAAGRARRGVTAAEAEQRALQACGLDRCHIVAWSCTR